MNPYYPYVWNKVDRNNQMIIMFYIDDLLLAHVDPSTIIKYIKLLDRVHGSKDPLTVIRRRFIST